MSHYVGKLYHPSNHHPDEIYKGFSWPCLFLGTFWYLYKGLWGWAVITFLAALFSFGLSWFVFPFFANAQHEKALRKKGYLTKKQVQDRGEKPPVGELQ